MNNTEYEFLQLDTKAKFDSVLKIPSLKIMCAYSGGKDSDILLHFITNNKLHENVTFVYFNTGLEYQATIRHVNKRIEQGHNIKVVRPKVPIPLAIKRHGQPLISKYVSEMLSRLQAHNFKFKEDGVKDYPELIKLYPKCIIALKWWCNYQGSEYDPNKHLNVNSNFNIKRNIYLKEFILINGLDFRVSNKCCQFAKKNPSKEYQKENKINLTITGIRKAEGGIRARAYKACFNDERDVKLYMPLFWWSNEDIKKYTSFNQIRFSDCYEEFGLKRTGCVACPYGKDYNFERRVVKQFEPKLSLAVENLFKDSFEFMDKYHFLRRQIKNKNKLNLDKWL